MHGQVIALHAIRYHNKSTVSVMLISNYAFRMDMSLVCGGHGIPLAGNDATSIAMHAAIVVGTNHLYPVLFACLPPHHQYITHTHTHAHMRTHTHTHTHTPY